MLFLAIAQVLGKVGQPHEDDAQPDDVDQIGLGIEHA
ncbi:hypothetical protein DESC_40083 [Desulfosarcina cetonica]|nr:hypothetical protein DESC_40083 [Desulfosarcina cetonica]